MGKTYKVAGRDVSLEQRDDMVAVRYREPALHSLRAAITGRTGARFEDRVEVPDEKYTLLRSQGPGGSSALAQALQQEQALSGSGVARVAPVFGRGNTHVIATDRVLIGLKDKDQPVEHVLAGVQKLGVQSLGNGVYLVQLPEHADPLAVAEDLAAREHMRYAEPDFVYVWQRLSPGSSAAPSATVPLEDQQYAMKKIQAEAAWAAGEKGSESITIAVIDEGVDTGHKDLRRAIVTPYDAIDDDTSQDPYPWDGHGTACAGLAAAMPDGNGIRGVGGGCSLMPIRVIAPTTDGLTTGLSISKAVKAIEWAWRHGADVLSMSWCIDQDSAAESPSLDDAIGRALVNGRGGKGCVLVAGVGNDGGPVAYPASRPGVIGVSATTKDDVLKNWKNGEDPRWASCFGPEVGIAAPGVHTLTTDNRGPGGYVKDSDYTFFDGTSAATPLVAGAAGFILSRYPQLEGAQVVKILKDSADKIGKPATYQNGRNDQFGHGRLNLAAALKRAAQVAAGV